MPVCFVPSSNRADAILSATFLPPIEEEAAYIPSPRHVPFIHRLRRRYNALAGQRGFIAAGRWQGQHCFPHPECGKISTFLPPAVAAVLAVQSAGFLDYTPTPGPMDGAPMHSSTPADGQPLHSLRVCLRLRARAGRQTLKPQADLRDYLSFHCVARHLPIALILM